MKQQWVVLARASAGLNAQQQASRTTVASKGENESSLQLEA